MDSARIRARGAACRGFPKAATVDRHGELVPESSSRGVAEQRDRPTVVEAAFTEPKRHGIPGALLDHGLNVRAAVEQLKANLKTELLAAPPRVPNE